MHHQDRVNKSDHTIVTAAQIQQTENSRSITETY